MITKKAIDRFDNLMFKTVIKPFFEAQGFKFKKRDGIKKMGDFELTFSCYCNDRYRGVYYNPNTQRGEVHFVSYLKLWHPAFLAWCKTHSFDHAFLGADIRVAYLKFILPIDIKQLSFGDFFTNINGNPINGLHAQDLGYPCFLDMIGPEQGLPNWHALIRQAAIMADMETIYCAKPGSHGKYVSLVYREELERAKAAVQELWQIRNQAYQDEPRFEYKQYIFSELRQLQSRAKEFLNVELKMEMEEPLMWKSIQTGEGGKIPFIDYAWQEIYTLKNLPRSVYRYFLSDMGELLTTHTSANKGEVMIWGKDGQVKHHVIYHEIRSADYLGFIPEKKAYFMGNFLIFEDGKTQYLPIPQLKDGNGDFEYEWVCAEVVYDLHLLNYIVCSIKERYKSTVWFFNDNLELVKTLELQGKPRKIYTDKQWIVVLDDKENTCTIYDYEGVICHAFAAKNAMFSHQFSNDYRWLVVHGYYAQSEVYDLSTKKTFKIYGHPTYKSGYKNHFVNVEHNFGLSNIVFSPDHRYAVGSAEHGKLVVWTLPDWKRQELKPNAGFISECIEPYSFEIDGESYFVNNGQRIRADGSIGRSCFMNMASAIYFVKDGAYFLLAIKDNLLVFNNQFEHVYTYKGLENIHWIGDYFVRRIDKDWVVGSIMEANNTNLTRIAPINKQSN